METKVHDPEKTTADLEAVKTNICADCHKFIVNNTGDGSVGYVIDEDGNQVCYSCQGYRDKGQMFMSGFIVLADDTNEVINWVGTLRFAVTSRIGYDRGGVTVIHFVGPDGFLWEGLRDKSQNEFVRFYRVAIGVDNKRLSR